MRDGYSTLYQFGRKDPLPGTDNIAQGNYSFDPIKGGRSLGYAIQHPENMFGASADESGTVSNRLDWCNTTYINLWSADNIVYAYDGDRDRDLTYNDNPVAKTIYDPCPAGFKMPASNAFTGFARGGGSANPRYTTQGTWQPGFNFNNRLTDPDATLYFHPSGLRRYIGGNLSEVGEFGYYWTAVTFHTNIGNMMQLGRWMIHTKPV